MTCWLAFSLLHAVMHAGAFHLCSSWRNGANGCMHAGSAAVAAEASRAPAPALFFAKRIADPGLIPMLVAAGVEFGALQVRSRVAALLMFAAATKQSWGGWC